MSASSVNELIYEITIRHRSGYLVDVRIWMPYDPDCKGPDAQFPSACEEDFSRIAISSDFETRARLVALATDIAARHSFNAVQISIRTEIQNPGVLLKSVGVVHYREWP